MTHGDYIDVADELFVCSIALLAIVCLFNAIATMGKKGKGGKAPTGRAKQRQKGPIGRDVQYMPDDSDDNTRKSFKGFSQGTPRGGFSQQGSNVKLRHQTISFVSAGDIAPIKLESTDHNIKVVAADEEVDSEEDYLDEQGESEIDDSNMQTNVVDAEVEISGGAFGQMNLDSPPAAQDLFVVDTVGDPSLAFRPVTNGKQRAVRSLSPARSDTSDDVVVFHGRSKAVQNRSVKPAPTPKASTSKPAAPSSAATSTVRSSSPLKAASSRQSEAPDLLGPLLDTLNGTPEPSVPSKAAKGWASKPSKYDQQASASAESTWQAAPSTPYWREGKPRPDLDAQPSNSGMIEDSSSRPSKVMFAEPEKAKNAEETIADLQADWKSVLREKRLSKDAPTTPDVAEVPTRNKPNRKHRSGRKKSNRQMRDAILSDDDEDEDEAAYDDYMANLVAQMEAEDGVTPMLTSLQPSADAGPSLVVDGRVIAEDSTLKHDTEQDWEDEDSDLSDSDAPIGLDLSELSDMDQGLNMSDLDSSELEDELEYTEREQWEDEVDLRQRRIAAMDDEHLARLFAKQQELGIDADEIVIDDGVYDAMEGVGDVDAASSGLKEITNSAFARKSPRQKRSRAKGDFSFPDASALADTVEQYGQNGFDIMDFDRPSLRNTKKGRKGKMPPELDDLSDDELRDEMLGAWENDREKKRQKKVEREELRSQGMLGASGRKSKADLSQKYLQGMTMVQVHEELAIFLQDDRQTSRSFPPMAKKDRASLHIVADHLNLKSKSVGTGHSRAPVLYKTGFTAVYNEAALNRIMSGASRGFLKNSKGKGKGKIPKGPGRARNAGMDKSNGLRDGQVVGGDARELGAENFGHKLMQKMGWKAGTALGKDGEGLLVPVAQVMRSGKAGLG
ncbi:squalene synthetase-like protein [Elasticomyces elasticus]|uniref:Squalene synthetase-like protein n=1 Tax=Elasticomyces elasticus TaxID=574655 RepID=A0AAN7W7E9_9PEZI|nr:squalene synthetase-like protein [Elasticomyces elasticus]